MLAGPAAGADGLMTWPGLTQPVVSHPRTVSGLPIVAINVEIGDTVKKGQVLARLDDSTTAAAVARAEAQLAQARAREDEARINRKAESPCEAAGSSD